MKKLSAAILLLMTTGYSFSMQKQATEQKQAAEIDFKTALKNLNSLQEGLNCLDMISTIAIARFYESIRMSKFKVNASGDAIKLLQTLGLLNAQGEIPEALRKPFAEYLENYDKESAKIPYFD